MDMELGWSSVWGEAEGRENQGDRETRARGQDWETGMHFTSPFHKQGLAPSPKNKAAVSAIWLLPSAADSGLRVSV